MKIVRAGRWRLSVRVVDLNESLTASGYLIVLVGSSSTSARSHRDTMVRCELRGIHIDGRVLVAQKLAAAIPAYNNHQKKLRCTG